MLSKSVFYQNPILYKFGLKFIHGKNFERRYKFLASFVKEGDLILEPGCGPAILAQFLPRNSFYYGFDINKSFINYALKKKLKVWIGDVLDERNYFPVNGIFIIDLLHHLKTEERKVLLKNCWKFTKNFLAICEPYRDKYQKKFWFEYIERDGKNLPKIEDFFGKEKLKREMKKGFSQIKNFNKILIKEIGKDLIAFYSK